MIKRRRNFVCLFLAGIAILGALFVLKTNTFAEEAQEALVEITVKNDPASATLSGLEQDALIPKGDSLPGISVEYKNAKKIVVTLMDPDGEVLGTKTIEVGFSPDAQVAEIDWSDVTLSKFGKYSISIVATSTDGTEVSGESIFFYYGEVPAGEDLKVPDTGNFNFFGMEISKGSAAAGLIVVILAIFAGLIVVLKKGVKNEN